MSTSPTPTALLPIDPAVSPQQVTRILPIRVNLMPTEITASRNSRRVHTGLISAVAVVIALVAAWYGYALSQKSAADDNLAAVNEQVRAVQERKKAHSAITTVVNQQETLSGQLSTLLAQDLPWSTLLTTVRTTGTAAGVSTTTIGGTLITDSAATSGAGKAPSSMIGSLTISGVGRDKKTIANFVDALGKITGVNNAYLTSATQTTSGVEYSVTASIDSAALCGRFTTACKTGGK